MKNRFRSRLLVSLAIALVMVGTAVGQVSLEPVDTRSPRATFKSFLENMDKIRSSVEEKAPYPEYSDNIDRVIRCIDLSSVPLADRENDGRKVGMLLAEVLGRVELPDFESIPGGSGFDSDETLAWTVPGTEVTISMIREGDRVGEYLFNTSTVERVEQFYGIARKLPYKEHAWEDAYVYYLSAPGRRMPGWMSEAIPGGLNEPFLNMPGWKILAFIFALTLFVLAVVAVFLLRRKLDLIRSEKPVRHSLVRTSTAFVLILLLKAFQFTFQEVIGLRGTLQDILFDTTFISGNLVVIYGVMSVFDLLYSIIVSSERFSNMGFDYHLLKIITQLIGFIAVLFIAIRAVEYLGLHLIPLIAGLGVGSVAIALAARPTLENIIGGLILFADKPVKIGDLARYGDNLGYVEEIGLRSTRIRKFNDIQVSVPNSLFSQVELENLSRRRRFLYQTILTLRYETTRDQLRYVLVALREMFLAHPKAVQDKMRVRFFGFGDYSLDIEVFVYLQARDWPDSLAVREDVNFRIMQIVEDAGAGFAYPSTTAYMTRDSMPDVDKARDAEKQVEDWKEDDAMPFPYFEKERLKELKGTLDYPPEGSPAAAVKREKQKDGAK